MFAKRSMWRFLLVAVLLVAPPVITTVHGQQPRKPADEEFVPIDQLPPGEQLPAAPLLIAAYSVVWILTAGYLFSIWKRLSRVEQEIADVNRRLPQRPT